MHLTIGTRLGPYEILASLGAGAMGEVYRARDTRLGREVAIKTLPPAFAADPERRARFESEARTVAALSHPNVLALHDIGTEDGIAYAVMELVEGGTLRERLSEGPLAASRALPLAIQIAHGLAAAHDRGVVHRDLKPENIIITPEGRAKILDFGLAKLQEPAGNGSQSMAPTQALGTEPGMVLGTVGYMSPEQVKGQAADARSDLFAFGALVYEMLTGMRAFRGDSPVETMSAILREDPLPVAAVRPETPPALERIVLRCLEKQPASRFRSAADLAFALESLSASGSSGAKAIGAADVAMASGRLSFHRLTFRNGHVAGARFTPDGASVVYGAAWDGEAHQLYTSRIGSPESRSLGLPAGSLLAMSSNGEMAVSLGYRHDFWYQVSGALARVPLAGGGMRPIQKDVGDADWSPDGRSIAVIRYRGGRCQLEYPPGKVLAESEGWLGCCRISPDGRRVAFARHELSGEGSADLCVVDPDGSIRVLVHETTNLNGIVWARSGEEVLWSGINAEQRNGVWAVRLDGSTREMHHSPTRVTLHDVRADGAALLSFDEQRICLSVGGDPDAPERDLSWFDASGAVDLSADGSEMLFIEVGEAENPNYACYSRALDGSPAVRIGTGSVSHYSPDGNWIVTVVNLPEHELMLYPTGFGEARRVPFEGIQKVAGAMMHPDGQQLYAVGSNPGFPNRLYSIPLAGGPARRLWDEELRFQRFVGTPVSPDGDRLVLQRASGEHVVYATVSGEATIIAGLRPADTALRFDASGGSLFVSNLQAGVHHIERLDLASGQRTPWRTLRPASPMGVLFLSHPVVSADGARYAYSCLRAVSNLYLVEGLG